MAKVYSYDRYKQKKNRNMRKKSLKFKFNTNRVLWITGCFLLVFFLTRLYFYQAKSLEALSKQKATLEAEISLVQEETQKLNDELILLDDLDYIEYVARTEYGMVAKGDLIFVPSRSNNQ